MVRDLLSLPTGLKNDFAVTLCFTWSKRDFSSANVGLTVVVYKLKHMLGSWFCVITKWCCLGK